MAHIKSTDQTKPTITISSYQSAFGLVSIWAASCLSVCVSGKASLIAQALAYLVYLGLLAETEHRSDGQTDMAAAVSMVTDC